MAASGLKTGRSLDRRKSGTPESEVASDGKERVPLIFRRAAIIPPSHAASAPPELEQVDRYDASSLCLPFIFLSISRAYGSSRECMRRSAGKSPRNFRRRWWLARMTRIGYQHLWSSSEKRVAWKTYVDSFVAGDIDYSHRKKIHTVAILSITSTLIIGENMSLGFFLLCLHFFLVTRIYIKTMEQRTLHFWNWIEF